MNNQFQFYLIILSIIVSFILYYIIRPRIPILYEALVCTYVTLFCLYLVIQGEYILLIGGKNIILKKVTNSLNRKFYIN